MQLDDNLIIENIRNGDRKAFEMIIQRYQQPLLNYIGRMVRDHELALDFTQEVFIKSYSSLHSFKSQYKFSTWLFKIASNLVIDFWRKKKIDYFSIDQQTGFENDKPPIQIPGYERSIGKKYELQEIRERIESALNQIPPSLRELFIWKHINDFSYEEIAEIKELPVGTIKNRIYQAKEQLRNLLKGTI
ncbi:MAG: sigma-70 family RNA polymerase sigma factor [Candidatus Aminicenantes bacterium]|nr:sigma-70 family RNA polymerase sigma factor [Candidatus Aminicenantes bacterium]